MKHLFLSFLFIVLSTVSAFAQKKVAVVKLLRGDVNVLTLGKTTQLKVEDWVEDGSVVKTAEKSFVKLVFIDKSQMNIGPGSEMKIERFNGKDSGVIDLVKGKIRSQVTKDYLQMDQDKSKLFIKTQNAVMGVRGTDFMIATNGVNTSTVLFEGSIVFNKLDNRAEINSGNLEDIVNRGVSIAPGEFSVIDQRSTQPTVPALLNVNQREKLEKSETFEADRSPGASSTQAEAKKGVVPDGLTGQTVSNDAKVLKTEVAQVISAPATSHDTAKPHSSNPEGYVAGDKFKPVNGSYLHVDTGIIVAPPANSVYDSNTNTYIPVNSGTVSASGDYVPPKNMEITPDGQVLVSSTTASGQVVVQKVETVTPVITVAGSETTQAVGTTTSQIGDHPITNSGGLTNYNTTTQQNTSGGVALPGTTGQIINSPSAHTTITVGQ